MEPSSLTSAVLLAKVEQILNKARGRPLTSDERLSVLGNAITLSARAETRYDMIRGGDRHNEVFERWPR